MQTNIQAVMAFMPSVLGELEVTVLKILISTRNRVINMAIRPGTTSGGTKKLTQDTTTNRPTKNIDWYVQESHLHYSLVFLRSLLSLVNDTSLHCCALHDQSK